MQNSTAKIINVPWNISGHWNYCDDGECGPCHWPNADGLQQSPIDIVESEVKKTTNCEPMKFVNYHRILSGEIVNNGHSIQITPKGSSADLPEIFGGGLDQVYQLSQYHFHWSQTDDAGSEHTVNGHRYPGELHLVHIGAENPEKIAVLAVFLELSNNDKALKEECNIMERVHLPSKFYTIPNIKMEDKLPANKSSFWRYNGSLTTPPCTECVTWTVFTEPISITKQQLEEFRKVQDSPGHLLEKNYRPVQKLNEREVYEVVTE
uniref:Carbonic anhydrase n=1 Tax=Syphacia muris TaxID=451379 RepID=A0A0N5A923_9BILA